MARADANFKNETAKQQTTVSAGGSSRIRNIASSMMDLSPKKAAPFDLTLTS